MHQCVNYEDSMSRLAVKPCPRCRALERENRRLRIRLGLATGMKQLWFWQGRNDVWWECEPRAAVSEMTFANRAIRLGDGTPEQEHHDGHD